MRQKPSSHPGARLWPILSAVERCLPATADTGSVGARGLRRKRRDSVERQHFNFSAPLIGSQYLNSLSL